MVHLESKILLRRHVAGVVTISSARALNGEKTNGPARHMGKMNQQRLQVLLIHLPSFRGHLPGEELRPRERPLIYSVLLSVVY